MCLRKGIGVAASAGLLVLGLALPEPGWTRDRDTKSADCNANGVPDESEFPDSFRRLGDLPGGAFMSEASAISADGSVVVGKSAVSTYGEEAFRWTTREGMVALGLLPSAAGSAASDVSADGAVIVGTVYGGWFGIGVAFHWTGGTGIAPLGHLPQGDMLYSATAPAVSADGALVVGGDCVSAFSPVHCQAYRWTHDEGMIDLGHVIEGFFESTATAIAADGSIVGSVEVGDGHCDCIATGVCGGMHDAFRWTGSDGMTALGLPPTGCNGSEINDLSSDGTILVGTSGVDEAFFWTAESGMVLLGDLPGGPVRSAAKAISGDGTVVVGNRWSAAGTEAFIWDAADGMRSLCTVLTGRYGLDLSGWHLTSANDISADGRHIVGSGVNPDGHTEGWIATLPAVDSDGDGVVGVCDACDHSISEETLSIGGCETGIANGTGADGCTLADALATTCSAGTTGRARGELVACVAHLAEGWREAGRIDRDEAGRLVACAGRTPK